MSLAESNTSPGQLDSHPSPHLPHIPLPTSSNISPLHPPFPHCCWDISWALRRNWSWVGPRPGSQRVEHWDDEAHQPREAAVHSPCHWEVPKSAKLWGVKIRWAWKIVMDSVWQNDVKCVESKIVSPNQPNRFFCANSPCASVDCDFFDLWISLCRSHHLPEFWTWKLLGKKHTQLIRT